ncbi:hypothetical protein [Dawidia soli]|uniref:Uncharacterized protein n=1 Tax=Dawidia soli TaxID=2782352 RepID=A0AAP2GIB2_9BACT|nr:hypothetical protein [Dawidia soli]MBT1686783.1 hypothetical protein [Dawidia soli]
MEREPATALMDLLRERGIACELEEDSAALGAVFVGHNTASFFRVKLRAQDFSQANALLETQASHDVVQVDPEHYLFSFTDQELLALLGVPDEWSELDYQLAQHILKDRGYAVNAEMLDKLRQDRLQELAKPDTKNRVWIFIGYLFAFLGGWIGVIIGLHLVTYKKTLPNGQRLHDYTPRDREHGRWIVIIGVTVFIVNVLYWALA